MFGRGRSLLVGVVVILALGPTLLAPPAWSGRHAGGTPVAAGSDNPLAGRPWATYQGRSDEAWIAYHRAHGKTQRLLAKIALAPRTRWYGDWIPTGRIESTVRRQLAVATLDDPDTVAPLADFRLKPWEGEACHRLPTRSERRDYKAWTRKFAAGIGDYRVSVVLQPDGPFALCAPHGSRIYSHLLAYAARKLSALPNATVYIDAGASDWLRNDPAKAVRILLHAGVSYARGFALNSTHYASTADQIRFGTAVVHALARRGVGGKHFLVNTAANGRPFDGFQYHGRDFDNAETCKTKQQRRCVTLGIPPTADVADPQWRLPQHVAAMAVKNCDGYQWIGRPWLFEQAAPFVKSRALDVARTTPYRPLPPLPPPAPPTVTGVRPSSGPDEGGTVVTVTGAGFTGATAVSFSNVHGSMPVQSYTVVSDTELRAVMPPYAYLTEAMTVDINVSGSHGYTQTSTSVPADRFTYLGPPRLVVTGVSPSSGPSTGGTTVTITGSGFTGAFVVMFGGYGSSNLTVVSDTELRVTTPPHSGPGQVSVSVNTWSSADGLRGSALSPAAVFSYVDGG